MKERQLSRKEFLDALIYGVGSAGMLSVLVSYGSQYFVERSTEELSKEVTSIYQSSNDLTNRLADIRNRMALDVNVEEVGQLNAEVLNTQDRINGTDKSLDYLKGALNKTEWLFKIGVACSLPATIKATFSYFIAK